MKKYIPTIFTILQMLLIIATTLLHHFTKTRMGMSRHMIYFNQEFPQDYPLEIIYPVLCFLFLLYILLAFKWCIYKQSNIELILQGMIHILTCIAFILYTFYYNTGTMRSYYIICIGLAAMVALQHLLLLHEHIGFVNFIKKISLPLISILYVLLKITNKVLNKAPKKKAQAEDYPH